MILVLFKKKAKKKKSKTSENTIGYISLMRKNDRKDVTECHYLLAAWLHGRITV